MRYLKLHTDAVLLRLQNCNLQLKYTNLITAIWDKTDTYGHYYYHKSKH